MNLWPRTFLWRLVLAVTIVQIVLTAGLGAYGYLRTRSVHVQETLATIDRLTPLLSHRYAEAIERGDREAIKQMVAIDAESSAARITIIAADGTVIAESSRDANLLDNHRFRAEIDAAMRSGEGTATRFSATIGREMLYAARAVRNTNTGEVVGVVRLAVPLGDVHASFRQTIPAMMLIVLPAIILSILILFLLSRRFSRQAASIGASAARIAGGDLNHRIQTPEVEELARLVRPLNDMAAQLAGRVAQAESQERELAAILQSMSNGVIALDAEQRVLSMNAAAREMLNLHAARIEQRLLQEVVREPQIHQFVDGAMRSASPRSAEFTIASGKPRLIQANAELLRNREGEGRGLLIVMNDVTQLRRLESMRSDFAANVSHELRTPITNIKGYVETLMDVGVGDQAQAHRFLDIIKKNSDRLAAIVEDVMALTRLERDEAASTLEMERVPLARIAQTVASQFRTTAHAKSMSIKVINHTEADLALPMRQAMIEQALGNLLANAITYSPPGTTVTITLKPAAELNEAHIEVRDEGPGIAAAHLPRLFERFYRVDKGRSRELGGTGLGLAIVKHIVNAHGGRIEVESEVGHGSTFRIVLPM